MFAIARAILAVSRSVRLVDPTLWRMDRLFAGHAGQWNGGVCADIFAFENGRAKVFGVQFGGRGFLHGRLFGNVSGCGCIDAGRIPNVRDTVADERRVSGGRFSGGAVV